MIKTFTPNDVLKNLSGELPPEDSSDLDHSILESSELEAFAAAAEQLESEIPNLIQEPGNKPLKNIMAFIEGELKINK